MLVGVLLVVATLVGSIGLFVFRVWGRNLFVFSLVALVIISPFFGPTVEHGFESFFSELESLSDGIILGILFFTDAIKSKARDA